MSTYYIYMTTDANRRFLQPGLSTDLALTKHEINNPASKMHFQGAILNRMVYIESFNLMEDAEKRLQELNSFGRIVRERLIRRANPNWLSLQQPTLQVNPYKKAVVYA